MRAQEEALQSRVLAGLEELAAHSSAHESRLRALEGGGASPRPGPPPAAAEGGGGGGGGVASNDVAALKEWLSAQLAEIELATNEVVVLLHRTWQLKEDLRRNCGTKQLTWQH